MLNTYLQQLVEEGELDSHGRITLDPAQARQKLAQHRFMHLAEGLLALVGACILAKASRVRVLRQGSRWEFLSDGEAPSAEQLQNLLQNLFQPQQLQSLKELGLALNSLVPKHCAQMQIHLADCWAASHSEGLCKIQDGPPSPAEPPFTQRIILHQHPPWNRLWQWLKSHWNPHDEMKILRGRTRWSPIPIYFSSGGRWLSSYDLDPPQIPPRALALLSVESTTPFLRLPPFQGPQSSATLQPDGTPQPLWPETDSPGKPASQAPPHADASQPLFTWERRSRARSSVRCALLPGDPDQSSLLLVYRGLTMAQQRVRSQVFRFEGVLNTDTLDLDGSRRNIVPNERLRQRSDTARQWVNEGAAAWISQLDPQHLSESLRSFLSQALMRLNKAKALRGLVQALGPLPLILLSDKKTYLSLDELRSSLTLFEVIHYAREGPAFLHDRPLVLAETQNLDPLRRLLSTDLLDANAWASHAYRHRGTSLRGAPQSFQQCVLRGSDWQAIVYLPLDFHSGNRLIMHRKGYAFYADERPLFEDIPCNFEIRVDGDYTGSLENAQQRVLQQLRQQLSQQVEIWLQQMQQEARSGAATHDSYYCSLLCLWMRPPGAPRRQPSSSWLEYPVLMPAPRGDRVLSLSQLLANPSKLGRLSRRHPLHTLAGWLQE